LQSFFKKLDRICGRMNGALAAFAVALAVVVYATALVRTPNLISAKATQRVYYGADQALGSESRPGF